MRIVYLSSAMEKDSFSRLFSLSSTPPGQQVQKFNRLMIEGLGKNGVSVKAFSGIPVTSSNCPRRVLSGRRIRQGNVTYRYPLTLNIRGLKNLFHAIAAFCSSLKSCLRRDSAVACDVLNASVSFGGVLAGRLMHRPCIGIVTDLPHLMVTGTNRRHTKLVNRTLSLCTGYVFLTEAMNEKVNPKRKPYTIIEGLCEAPAAAPAAAAEQSAAHRVCMYAGLLDARYGAEAMVDAFILANLPNVQLHLYGSGPYASQLPEISKSFPNVVYHGTVFNDEIIKAELAATLLINPRPTSEEYTKYSFPSKNMEYMASGTPVLTTCLPGMPKEYYPYVYLFEDESAEGMAQTLRQVLTKPAQELAEKGSQAKQFVLREKSNVRQAQKLLDMLEK